MEKIPTAEEYIKEKIGRKNIDQYFTREELAEMFIDFTKLHVKACKKEMSELVDKRLENESEIRAFLIDGSSILKAYPLDNIK